MTSDLKCECSVSAEDEAVADFYRPACPGVVWQETGALPQSGHVDAGTICTWNVAAVVMLRPGGADSNSLRLEKNVLGRIVPPQRLRLAPQAGPSGCPAGQSWMM